MRPSLAVSAALVIAVSAGCGGDTGLVAPPGIEVTTGSYDFTGSIVSVDRPRNIVSINHEAIPGVMPAMTMPYEVADPSLLQGLAPGDRVRGTLRVDSRGFVITALTKT